MRAAAPEPAPVWSEEERRAIALSGGKARREGSRLVLQLAGGRRKVFVDDRWACDHDVVEKCVKFSLVKYRADRGVFIVGETFYEGAGFQVIDDQTGSALELSDEPLFGPDPDRILVFDQQEAYSEGPQVQIWNRSGHVWTMEWHADYESPAFAFLKPYWHSMNAVVEQWERPERIVFALKTYEDGKPSRHFELLRNAESWSIRSAPQNPATDGVLR